MKKISWKRIKLIYIETMFFTMMASFLFLGETVRFEKTGDNFFYVELNGQTIGTVDTEEDAEKLLVEARKAVAGRTSEMLFLECDLSCRGEELLWGTVDDQDVILERMKDVLEKSVQENLHKAYTIKINELTLNLHSLDEVETLLQAVIDKYDSSEKFKVRLCQDNDREFSVLGTLVEEVSGKEDEEGKKGLPEAGIQAFFTHVIDSAQPEVEKGFEDYKQGILEMDFPQDVEIVEAYLPLNHLANLEQAIEELTKEEELKTTYKIQSGDTLSEIAIKVNIPMEQIIAMNPWLGDGNTVIRVGDELVITVPEPKFLVSRVEENYIEEVYDADVVYVDNDSWYTTKTKVLQQPSAGFRKIIARSSFLNDELVNREIIKEEVVMEAVPKIVERGTKIPPTYIRPISGGRLTSPFGKRAQPTAGASTYHKGVDLATPTGTSVVASSGGKVVKAGWGSGYGYVVYIDHADGRQTRYAHLSKVLVKVGQTVKQGERIALSGNTGVTTGPHLHFELLINGSQVDPFKYIK